MASIDKCTLRCVIPLGRPKSVYKGNVEMPLLGFEMAVWPWWSRLMTPVCYTSQANLQMHIWRKFGDSSSNPCQVIVRTSQISYNSESKWPKWLWSSRSMTPIFDTRQEWPMMHIWCNLVIPVMSYFHGQAEFPRSQNGQHDLENQGQWPLFLIPAQNISGSMFGANLVTLAQICEDLLTGQIKFPKNLSQNSQNELEGHGQGP